jgi:DMSO/TMAO reductase YedYZ molybdopterin-dependent catalytic subunit
MASRRDFLKLGTAGFAALAFAHRALGRAPDQLSIRGKDGMLIRSGRFLDLETPVEDLDSWITPVPHFFVRNHMHEPVSLDSATWKLTVSGEVENPLRLNLADLAAFETHLVVNTLECAGNGRGLQQPPVPGVQWGKGAVGTARFSGARLRDVLQRAGLKSTAKHIMFRGLDEVPGKVPPFIRSIPVEKATDADTLIATRMNGAALTKHHGFPARALVPGWIGAASCKWLSEIKVLDHEFDGNFMNPGYRMPNRAVQPGEAVKPEDTHVVTGLQVKSLITGPINDSSIKGRTVQIRGAAWAGEAEIVKVEISTDAGQSWHPAQLASDRAKYAWRLWHYAWRAPEPGDYTLWARATDNMGRVQPDTATWNPSGYLYNAIDKVRIHVYG